MPKTRVFALAKELGLESKALVAVLAKLGLEGATPATALDDEQAVKVRESVRQAAETAAQRSDAERAVTAQARILPGAVGLLEAQNVAAAAQAAEKAAAEAKVKEAAAAAKPARKKPRPVPVERDKQELLGEPVQDVVEEVVEEEEVDEEAEMRELEKELERLEREEQRGAGLISLEALTPEEREEERRRGRDELVKPIPERARRPVGERPETAIDGPPVVCVLGHVDHGKTTLLDAIRDTNVVDGEHGGITQHIGASEVEVGGRRILFLDTPGHAAFTAMRARGALVTDIAILIVAADDGIMPQTVEAINHIRAAEVPIIVAINKIDAPGANVDRVHQQLAEHDLVPESWGGETVAVEISALKAEGIDELLEMIFLVAEAELGDIWADPEAPFASVVIEGQLDPSRGPVTTVVIRNGSVAVGDVLISGGAHGRVRRINDWRGKSIKGTVGPGRAVEIIGLSQVPDAGDIVEKASSAKAARQFATERQEALRDEKLATSHPGGLAELFKQFQEGGAKDLNLVIKADVWGSLQAMRQAMFDLNDELEEVDINIIHDAVGDVSESDVLLAVASNGMVIGFQVSADANARSVADSERIDIRTYNVIYEALDEIRAAMHGMLDPVYEEQFLGRAEVLQVFKSSSAGVIAGCVVTEGHVEINADMRVHRGDEVVYEGRLRSLRHVAQDVSSIDVGTECGIATPAFRQWAEGDIIEASKQVEVPRKIPAPTDARPTSVGAGRAS